MDGRDLLLHELRTVPPQSSMIKFPDLVFEAAGAEVFNEMGNSEGAPDLKFETGGEEGFGFLIGRGTPLRIVGRFHVAELLSVEEIDSGCPGGIFSGVT